MGETLDKCGFFRYHRRKKFKNEGQKMIKLSYEQQIAFNSLSIIVGNALYALTVVLFLVPSGLITGGATGIALGINRALGLPVSGVLFVINMTMLAVGWVLLGRRFAITTIASTVLSPLFLALWERVFTGFVLTDDLVLNTIFAGLGVGISLGITIRAGASTGGMDIPPLVLNKYFHIPVSASMLVFDMLILCLQAAFSPLQQCLYGIVMVIVYTVVLDKVLIFGTTRTCHSKDESRGKPSTSYRTPAPDTHRHGPRGTARCKIPDRYPHPPKPSCRNTDELPTIRPHNEQSSNESPDRIAATGRSTCSGI